MTSAALESFSFSLFIAPQEWSSTDAAVLEVLTGESNRGAKMCRRNACKWLGGRYGLTEFQHVIWNFRVPGGYTQVVKIFLPQNNWFSNEESFFSPLPSLSFVSLSMFRKRNEMKNITCTCTSHSHTCEGKDRRRGLTGVIEVKESVGCYVLFQDVKLIGMLRWIIGWWNKDD